MRESDLEVNQVQFALFCIEEQGDIFGNGIFLRVYFVSEHVMYCF